MKAATASSASSVVATLLSKNVDSDYWPNSLLFVTSFLSLEANHY